MRRIQTFSAAALLLASLGLADCGRREASQAPAAPRAAVAPGGPAAPSLWRIEVVDAGKVVQTVDICADAAVHGAFSRPTPELNGKSCARVGEAVQTDKGYSVRCRIDEKIFRVGASQTGDPARDFTVEMAVTRQDKRSPMFEQTRHYRRLGACPAGWQVGDSAPPGGKPTVNALAAGPAAGPKAQ